MDGDRTEPPPHRPTEARDTALHTTRAVVCAQCAHALTTSAQGIEIGGRHSHTFMNPAGLLFHVRCFRTVDGAQVWGDGERETTWFPGTTWRFASCGQCRAHVGWSYVRDDAGAPFFALIGARIADG